MGAGRSAVAGRRPVEVRWSVRRKTDAVIRPLRGEDIDAVSRSSCCHGGFVSQLDPTSTIWLTTVAGGPLAKYAAVVHGRPVAGVSARTTSP
jgi:hypothetical protein